MDGQAGGLGIGDDGRPIGGERGAGHAGREEPASEVVLEPGQFGVGSQGGLGQEGEAGLHAVAGGLRAEQYEADEQADEQRPGGGGEGAGAILAGGGEPAGGGAATAGLDGMGGQQGEFIGGGRRHGLMGDEAGGGGLLCLHPLIQASLQGAALVSEVVAIRHGLVLLLAFADEFGLQALEASVERDDLLAGGGELCVRGGLFLFQGLLRAVQVGFEVGELALFGGEALLQLGGLFLLMAEGFLMGEQVAALLVEIVAAGLQVGLLPGERELLGVEGAGLLVQTVLVGLELQGLALQVGVALLETGLLVAKGVLLAFELFVGTAQIVGLLLALELLLGQAGSAGLQVGLVTVEGELAVIEGSLAGLEVGLTGIEALAAIVEAFGLGLEVPFGLIEFGGAFGEGLLLGVQIGVLGIESALACVFLVVEGEAFRLEGLDGGIDFAMAGIQFGFELLEADTLLFELTLVNGELHLLLLEAAQDPLEFGVGTGRDRHLLFGRKRLSHAQLPSSWHTAGRDIPPAAGIGAIMVPNNGGGNNGRTGGGGGAAGRQRSGFWIHLAFTGTSPGR